MPKTAKTSKSPGFSRKNWFNTKAKKRGISEGYRSGLEEVVAAQLRAAGVEVEFESVKLRYSVPARETTYTPDFPLPNHIIVETKGRFVSADRKKHKLIKEQHPDLDIRFVFSRNPDAPSCTIGKKSKTTYGMWCRQNGFKYATGSIPQEWIDEARNQKRTSAFNKAFGN